MIPQNVRGKNAREMNVRGKNARGKIARGKNIRAMIVRPEALGNRRPRVACLNGKRFGESRCQSAAPE